MKKLNKTGARAIETYAEVEKAFFQCGIYPESTKTFLTKQFGAILVNKREQNPWLEEALQSIFAESNFNSIYVTEAI